MSYPAINPPPVDPTEAALQQVDAMSGNAMDLERAGQFKEGASNRFVYRFEACVVIGEVVNDYVAF
jgi:hypothetical protein